MEPSVFFQFTLSILVMLIFLKGYFPNKQSEVTVTDPPNKIGDYALNLDELYSPTIDRLVFIVIDALREDFVTFENMPYAFSTQDCIFKVKVEAPTVTLPRIKAITTGDVPQFVDIILNLGAATKCHDSFLHRAQHAGKKMVFYGDDTWLKIYPDLFLRRDGTTSFYVNDFKEVDDNVTRHIAREMKEVDWDIMFLHYLGLDHIGHVRGPFSSLIKPKLHEMDDVIQSINEASKSWNRKTLILVTGDHGMKDSGGHGGTTYAETHVPLIAFGLPCNGNITILQTDIPATLSTLFGIQIPSTNVGRIISDFFPKSNLRQLLYVTYYNLMVLLKHPYACFNFEEAVKQHCDLIDNFNISKAQSVFHMYEECLFKISSELIASVEQNLALLLFGVIMTSVCLFIIIIRYLITNQNKPQSVKSYTSASYLITIIFLLCWLYDHYLLPIVLSACLLFYLSNKLLKVFRIREKYGGEYNTYIFLIILHAILLLSSSFVEEEHQIWYFYTGSVSLITCYNNLNVQGFFTVAIILGVRLLRMLNSTGDQWASYPDLADWFLIEENFIYLQILYIIALNSIYISLIKISLVDKIQCCLYFFVLTTIFVLKMIYPHIVNLAQFAWLIIVVTSIREMLFKQTVTHKITITWILIISLLMRPHNAILISSCVGASYLYTKCFKQIETSTIFHMWLGSTLFFCQGHSNSIASIDLAPSYIGLNSYIPSLVFSFTLFHTYAFPVLSLLLLLRKHQYDANKIFAINIINRLWILVVILIMVTIQRGHLFVWSVFAPKLLIEAVHTSVLYLEMCIYYFILYITN